MPVVTIGIAAATMAASAAQASASNRANRQFTEESNKRAVAAAKSTRETNIATTRLQMNQQREAVTRDSVMLLGQLAVSAAERGVTQSRSYQTSISTLVQGMMSNLNQVSMNAYMQEQQILAATQYPEYSQYNPINPLLSGIQGGLSGLSAGLSIAGGMRNMGWFSGSTPSVPTYAMGPGVMT
jgi:hypothetical protein